MTGHGSSPVFDKLERGVFAALVLLAFSVAMGTIFPLRLDQPARQEDSIRISGDRVVPFALKE
jgi:hypothetical protein